MKQISITHPDTTNNINTVLATDYAAGVTTITVKNTAGFAANDYLVVGKLGSEQTELVQINTITAPQTIAILVATKFQHGEDTPVTQIGYNQFKLYRSITTSTGSYTTLATAALQVDQPFNLYVDTSGQSSYFYKFSYYNSTSTNESDTSAVIPGTGFSFYSLKSLQDRVAKLFGDPNYRYLRRDEITDWLNEYYEMIQERITGGESPYYINYVEITSTGAVSYDLSQYDIVHLFLIETSTNGIDFDGFMLPQDFRYQIRGERNVSSYYRIGGDTMFDDPILPAGQTMRLWFFTTPVILVDQGDELLNPFKGHTRVFVNYALQRAFEKDRKVTEFSEYYQKLVDADTEMIVTRLKERIKAVGKAVAQTSYNDIEQVY